ncbi:hypothetical protein KDK95_23320 [Actinospica sp. MGRD01-02]|uniref:Uncharacterized protein n=1 Tax=Actinospica acidithermotolerans TaxID=2828514 RepID=A0A941ILP2_9ACTN|nr:hypothetical protein [Actinospica acidithermotolerans]MBR7829258.1 hypothetical protein [Actinospica acidithermotolerans]
MSATVRTIHRPGPRALKRHLTRAIRRRTRRTLKALSKRRNAAAARRAERQIERRRTLAANPAPNLIGPALAAKQTTSKPPAPKKTAAARPGAGKPCKRCNGTGVIRLRKGGKYAGAKPCPHVINQWKKARANTASPKPGGRP